MIFSHLLVPKNRYVKETIQKFVGHIYLMTRLFCKVGKLHFPIISYLSVLITELYIYAFSHENWRLGETSQSQMCWSQGTSQPRGFGSLTPVEW